MANETVNRYLNIYIQSGEAQKALDVLTAKEKKLNEEIAKAPGNAKKLKEELAALQEPLDRARKKVSGELQPSLKDTEAAARKLRNELKNMSETDADFGKTVAKLKQVNAELDDQRRKLGLIKETQKNMSQEAKAVFFGVSAAQFAEQALYKLRDAFVKAISSAGDLSDSLADIQRVTGMSAQEVDQLNKSLSKIDTRTSLSGLRDIAIIAGKLGVAKGEILGFTEAVDKLVVALGDELGDADAITTQLGKILNVFDGKVTGDNITRLGNAFVELANSGVASGAFLSDFDQRLSGIAKSAGISLGALTGLGAGLEEMGARVESSSTAVQKIIVTIAGDMPAAAKIAGKSINDFSKVFKDNAEEALLLYAEGLVKNKSSFNQVVAGFKDAGEEGARVIEVLASMGQNADMLRSRIDLGRKSMQDATAINEAFNLKNETLGASLDKLGKLFDRIFVNSRIPEMIGNVVRSIEDLVNSVESSIQEFDKLSEQVNSLDKNIVPLITRYDELKSKTTLSKDEQEEMRKIIAQVAETIPGAVTQFDEYGRAVAISTQRVRDFITAEKERLNVVNKSAIDEARKAHKELSNQYENMKRTRDEITRTGTYRIGETSTTGSMGATFRLRNANQQEVREFLSSMNKVAEEARGWSTEIFRLQGGAEKVIEIIPQATEEIKNNTTSTITNTTETEKNNKATDKRVAIAKELQNALEKYQLKAENDPFAREALQLSNDFNQLREKYQKEKDVLLQIEKNYQEAIRALVKKYKDQEWQEQEDRQNRLRALVAKQDHATSNPTISVDIARAALQTANNGLNKISRDQNAVRELSLLKANAKQRMQLINAQLEEERLRTLQNTEITENERSVLIANIDKKIAENRINYYVDATNQTLGFLQAGLDIFNTFSKARTDQENAELESYKKANDKKKEALQDRLNAGLISQQEYDRAVARMDKEQDKRSHDLAVKQFRRNQKMQIASTLMSGAQAAINMLTVQPAYVGLALAIAAGLKTVAEVAMIAKQKPPEYGRGGKLRGPSHAENKGMPVVDPRTNTPQAYLEGNEGIINKRTMGDRNTYTVTGTPSQIASSLNSWHGGVHWESGATMRPVWRMPKPSPMNYNGIRQAYQQKAMYVSGGLYNSSSTATTSGNNMELANSMAVMNANNIALMQTVGELSATVANLQKNGIPAYTLLSDQQRQQKRMDDIVADATMK